MTVLGVVRGAPDEPDEDALLAARAGDQDGFRVLFRWVQPGLLRYVRALVGEDAEDVVGETWAGVARDFGKFHGNVEGFRAWVVTVARNRAFDHLRRMRRRPMVVSDLDGIDGLDGLRGIGMIDAAAGRGDTAGLALEGMGTEAALRLIASLPPDQAEAVLLRVVVGLDAGAAGKVLGKRAGAVRTAAYRGLKTLSARLADAGASAESAGEGWGVTDWAVAALKEMR
ncbi:RNA polymerase sigma factor [Amycolatopsis pigmentata]|uniref:RNA polymerase sigma factor n=1 Tax=Amycolatopsis pigmentata TaxID=450801 RepID=UPI0036704316